MAKNCNHKTIPTGHLKDEECTKCGKVFRLVRASEPKIFAERVRNTDTFVK